MKILAVVENYPPLCRAGSEYALHHTLRGLRDLYGWESTVAITRPMPGAYQLEGIQVVPYDDCQDLPANLVVTQLFEPMHFAHAQADRRGVPRVYFHHTQHHPPGAWDLVVFNAQYLVDRWEYSRPYVVFHPPVYPEEYEVDRRDARKITRIGMSPQKGAYLFWMLAHLMPDREFLGVAGAWGPQVLQSPHGSSPNVTLIGNTDDIQSVYAQTQILLVPSDEHETWCRVAIEAAASGIPSICSGIPALRESLGEAGIHCRLDMIEDWVATIRCLELPDNYRCHSEMCRERAKQLHPDQPFARLDRTLRGLCG